MVLNDLCTRYRDTTVFCLHYKNAKKLECYNMSISFGSRLVKRYSMAGRCAPRMALSPTGSTSPSARIFLRKLRLSSSLPSTASYTFCNSVRANHRGSNDQTTLVYASFHSNRCQAYAATAL